MSIGVVIERLRDEFPDVTVSKLRFLESEGLITPQRTQSGYRRFTDEDIERLRFILITQRDNYLPLKVIREQLEAMDAGEPSALSGGISAPGLAAIEEIAAPEVSPATAGGRVTDTELAELAHVEQAFISELMGIGLITPDASGLFRAEDSQIVTSAVALKKQGIDARHLKSLRQAAVRQAGLVAQVAGPVAASGKTGSRKNAADVAQEMTTHLANIHLGVLMGELRRTLG
ncbi:MerR family transcriptional regulator [Corynebacterium aquatimens]|nr:MerR family transcriptional regulator [Corynebacterium aquatimens]WJY65899.1 zinc-responsive transcriptional regulator [Corynebacterium aquatimens]